MYNELKRNKISIPYDQIEIRERKDTVNLPINFKGIPKRVEKERKIEHNLDLENVNFSEIFKMKKAKKKKINKKLIKKENKEKINLAFNKSNFMLKRNEQLNRAKKQLKLKM